MISQPTCSSFVIEKSVPNFSNQQSKEVDLSLSVSVSNDPKQPFATIYEPLSFNEAFGKFVT